MPSPAGPAVLARALTKTYRDGTTGARDVSLDAARGEVVGILGPNGAGKSTTLNMLATLLAPTAGEAWVLGRPIADRRAVRPLLGIALQAAGLDPLMTGAQHLEAQAALYRLSPAAASERTRRVAELFGLDAFPDQAAGLYSGGQQRRLAVALALLHDPPVVILDEPTAGLDLQSRRVLWREIRALAAAGKTIVLSTQYLEEADLLCDRVYLIAGARVVASGSPSELRSAVGSLSVRVRVAGSPEHALAVLSERVPSLSGGRVERGVVVFPAAGDGGDAGAIVAVLRAAGLDLIDLTIGRPSLDDAFVALTGERPAPEPLARSARQIASFTTRGAAR